MNFLITGGAGFIGSHLVDLLLSEGHRIDVVDNFDPFYDPAIKEANIASHLKNANYRLHRIDIREFEVMRRELAGGYDAIVHLAAKAGVRPSIEDPIAYQEVNVRGTQNLLELAKIWGTPQFVFASSSSVYGQNPRVPWCEDDHVLMPISPYASTKVSGELLGHVYSHLNGIRFIGLRFFTVYGPRQRPDLAIHKFTRMILDGKSIPVFGNGSTRRDYTYISDIVAGIRAAIDFRGSPYAVVNLGNSQTVTLSEMIATIEEHLGVRAQIDRQADQPGDVTQTWADSSLAEKYFKFRPATPFAEGVASFVHWFHSQPQLLTGIALS